MQIEDSGNNQYTKIKNSNIKVKLFLVKSLLKLKYESSFMTVLSTFRLVALIQHFEARSP